MTTITTIEQLEALYAPAPVAASTVKVAHRMTPQYRRLIEVSPFAALATVGPEGIDCSPRGDQPGFVRIHDDETLMMPDRRGNNRIDSLRNIVRDPAAPFSSCCLAVAPPSAPMAAPISASVPPCWPASKSRARRPARSS